MCGIAGLVGVPVDHRKYAARLLGAVRHRGPDAEGVEHVDDNVTFVHTRLAIIDVAPEGNQPMGEQGRLGAHLWTVFNGEIYNYRELRSELAALGLHCRTQSDTEVILLAYRAWGLSCVSRFRGMFAFAIYDGERRQVVFCRDRLGIKPLYLYHPPQGGTAFASELKALIALGPELISAHTNPRAIEGYLAQGAVQGDETLLTGVRLLTPGTIAVLDAVTGRLMSYHRYWELDPAKRFQGCRNEAIEALSTLLRDAVRHHLISDVPSGIFLSGGLDSAALLSLATCERASVRTLSLNFDLPGFDESADAAATARFFGASHESITVGSDDILSAWPSIMLAMDQPTVDGTNVYLVSQAARQAGLTVALSGLGADELFGGYATFTDIPRAIAVRRRMMRLRVPGWIKHHLPLRSVGKGVELMARVQDPLGTYLLRRELFLPVERRALQPLPDEVDPESGIACAALEVMRQRAHSLDVTNQVSLFEIEMYMRNMLLQDGDTYSMAAPIEYRVPFLDHQLVEFAFGLPGEWKRRDPRLKPLLIDALGAGLPRHVWENPKRGFALPWGTWLARNGPLGETAEDALHDSDTWVRLGVDPSAVRRLWNRAQQSPRAVSPLQVLALVALREFAARHGVSS